MHKDIPIFSPDPLYDPFGQIIRATGSMAQENPFRFSTKRTDNMTDFVIYEFRFYDPSTAKWLSRDPLEEVGGLNIYAISRNDFLNHHDNFGLIGPVAGFALECLKEILGGVALDWIKNHKGVGS